MDETSPLFGGYETLSGARERDRAARAERRTLGRALGWLARWLLGVVPAGAGSLWMLSTFVGHDHGARGAAQITALVVHAALVIGALLLHPGLARRDRRLGTFALGVSTGLALALFLYVRASWSTLLPQALALPLLLYLVVTDDTQLAASALAVHLWVIAPLPLLGLCAWDAARAVRLLRGRAFGFRDCAWILLGLMLAVAACLGSGAWWVDVVP